MKRIGPHKDEAEAIEAFVKSRGVRELVTTETRVEAPTDRVEALEARVDSLERALETALRTIEKRFAHYEQQTDPPANDQAIPGLEDMIRKFRAMRDAYDGLSERVENVEIYIRERGSEDQSHALKTILEVCENLNAKFAALKETSLLIIEAQERQREDIKQLEAG